MKHSIWRSLLLTLFCLFPIAAKAQVTPDGTTDTNVTQEGNNFAIEQGDRVGDNLFHSFDEFSIPSFGSASFNNAADITNIFSRVTGGNISNIDGFLSANGMANLFLINPNGIIFGENAFLNLGGSFFASTADSLLFEGNTEFSAVNPQSAPLLEVSIPTGARFRNNPERIVNQAQVSIFQENVENFLLGLEVMPGKNLTLLGGDIDFESGAVTVTGGDVRLGGLAESGIVNMNEDGSLVFPENLTRANITLDNGAKVDVRGAGGGSVNIDAQNLTLTAGELGSSLILAGVSFESASNEAQAGDITIDIGELVTLNDSNIINSVDIGEVGDSGNIAIDTNSLEAINGGTINTLTFGRGNAGSINVAATGDITFDGGDSNGFSSGASSQVSESAVGNAGNVNISTSNLNLTDGGILSSSTFGQGDAGFVEIIATGDISIDGVNSQNFLSGVTNQVNPNARGNAAGITISTTNLNLTNSGRINAITFGEGDAGFIKINALEDITIDGEKIPGISSTINNAVFPGAVGNSQDITITTNNLTITNGGKINANTEGQGNAGAINITATGNITFDGEDSNGLPSGVESIVDSRGIGNAGGVTISTTNLLLTNGGIVGTSTFGLGNAGFVDVEASGDIIIDGETSSSGRESNISNEVFTEAVGDALGISLTASNLNLTDGGRISSTTRGIGNAGTINIKVTENITSSGFLAGIGNGAFVLSEGDAAGINISAANLTLMDGASISSDTLSSGDAGNIDIAVSENVFIDGKVPTSIGSSSIISSESIAASGSAGEIDISAANLILIDGASINTSTRSQSNAGSIIVDVSESIIIKGFRQNIERTIRGSNISANALIDSGDGGSINISTDELTIEDGGIIEATNFDSGEFFAPGIGQPGNIIIEANSISLDSGNIDAATQSETGDGANINIASEGITLDNNALISARAFQEADGGNLSIESGFVLAFPDGNNDIVARAEQGSGGRINIDTEAIFGLEERVSEPANFTNDIDASSEFGLQGDFSLNTPDFDPTSGLLELPAAVGDASDQISQNPCQQGVGSEFIVTGKGGLPINPNESLSNSSVEVGLVEPDDLTDSSNASREEKDNATTEAKSTPAQGWVVSEKGEVTLTAYAAGNEQVNRTEKQVGATCSARK